MADIRNGFARFTLQEFRVCVRAIFAFGAGYKLGERYKLGALERRLGQSWDPSASYSPKGPKVGPIPFGYSSAFLALAAAAAAALTVFALGMPETADRATVSLPSWVRCWPSRTTPFCQRARCAEAKDGSRRYTTQDRRIIPNVARWRGFSSKVPRNMILLRVAWSLLRFAECSVFADRGGDLRDLLVAVRARVSGVGDQRRAPAPNNRL
jgi:hypothetical protein